MSDTLDRFLDSAGWAGADRSALAGDASTRSYIRLRRGEQTAMLMIAPPVHGDMIRPFLHMTDVLRGHGLSAPETLAQDAEAGFLLTEDLGDALVARLAEDGALETQMYGAAIDVLVELARHPVPKVPPYDEAIYLRESRLVAEWYMPAATGVPCCPETMAELDAIISAACSDLRQDSLILRDYHAENLIWLPERVGLRRIGLLDYQDALAGDPAYDVVSLLEDARRDTSAELRQSMTHRYLDATGMEDVRFTTAYNTLGAQRNLKIMGLFTRLCVRDGKTAYPALLPRVWAHLMRDLQDPALADLAAWVTRHVPPPSEALLAKITEARGAA